MRKSLGARDAEIIWHPYTQHKTAAELVSISHGKDAWIYDENGNAYLDAISSWWTTLHGHANKAIAERIYQQALTLEHVIFAGCTHEPAVQLAEKLKPLLPGDFSRFFYSDNGSTAVEVALKMTIQYWQNQGQPKRNKIVALRHSYHGDTFGAMSVSERGVFTLPFQSYLFEVIFIDAPTTKNLQVTQERLSTDIGSIAAFIYEPLVQGAGGMLMYEAEPLSQLLEYFHSENVLCIADEVMTGFGRTGNLFAGDLVKEKADIICLSKGLTGGVMPMSLTVCTEKVFSAFYDDDAMKTLFHGHSFTANPLACAAALASFDLLQEEQTKERHRYLCEQNQQFVELYQSNPKFQNLRATGTILAYELGSSSGEYLDNLKPAIIKAGMKQNIFIRPLGNTVYILPPYSTSPSEVGKLQEFMFTLAEQL